MLTGVGLSLEKSGRSASGRRMGTTERCPDSLHCELKTRNRAGSGYWVPGEPAACRGASALTRNYATLSHTEDKDAWLASLVHPPRSPLPCQRGKALVLLPPDRPVGISPRPPTYHQNRWAETRVVCPDFRAPSPQGRSKLPRHNFAGLFGKPLLKGVPRLSSIGSAVLHRTGSHSNTPPALAHRHSRPGGPG